MAKDYPILDIGNNNGFTGYLDFITFNDQFNRPFFVVRTIITKSDGSTIKIMETFFQIYLNDKNLWHGCGHDGPYFLLTDGGMKLNQINFIESWYVDLTNELMDNIRFCIRPYADTGPISIKIELY